MALKNGLRCTSPLVFFPQLFDIEANEFVFCKLEDKYKICTM